MRQGLIRALFTASRSDNGVSLMSHESTKSMTSGSSVEGSSSDECKLVPLKSVCLLLAFAYVSYDNIILCTIIVELISNYCLHHAVTPADPLFKSSVNILLEVPTPFENTQLNFESLIGEKDCFG